MKITESVKFLSWVGDVVWMLGASGTTELGADPLTTRSLASKLLAKVLGNFQASVAATEVEHNTSYISELYKIEGPRAVITCGP